jgi:hypothetical protein
LILCSESVVQATVSARNSTLRFWIGIILAVAFFGGFLVKSYWEERVFERDTQRLLAYYQHVIPGSMHDGDEHTARYLVWKYRGKKDKLWRSLEKKYGQPVRHAHEWSSSDDEEEDEEHQDLDEDDKEEPSEQPDEPQANEQTEHGGERQEQPEEPQATEQPEQGGESLEEEVGEPPEQQVEPQATEHPEHGGERQEEEQTEQLVEPEPSQQQPETSEQHEEL